MNKKVKLPLFIARVLSCGGHSEVLYPTPRAVCKCKVWNRNNGNRSEPARSSNKVTRDHSRPQSFSVFWSRGLLRQVRQVVLGTRMDKG